MLKSVLPFLLTIPSTILFVETFLRLNVINLIIKFSSLSKKSILVIKSTELSDDQKEKKILNYSKTIFLTSLNTIFYIIFCTGLFLLSYYLLNLLSFTNIKFWDFVITIKFQIVVLLVGILYVYLKKFNHRR